MTTLELRAEYLRLSDLVGQDDGTLRRAVQALRKIVATVKPVVLTEDEKTAQRRERLAVVRQQKLAKLMQSGLAMRHQDLTVSPRTHELVAKMPRLAADFDYKEAIAEMETEETV